MTDNNNKDSQAVVMNGEAERKLNRAELRGKIFASKKLKTETIDFFGAEIELRQPSVGTIIESRAADTDKASTIVALIRQAYIPGTEELVFEDTDYDELLLQPFGQDFIRVTKALERLSEVNFLGTGTTSDVTTGDSQP